MNEQEIIGNLFKQHISPNIRELEGLLKKPAWKNVLYPWLKALRELRVNGVIWTSDNHNRDVWAGQIMIIDQILGLGHALEMAKKQGKKGKEIETPADWESAIYDPSDANSDLEP